MKYMSKEKRTNKKNGIYLLFAFISIIFFYISINVLYTQTYYDEDLINNLPNAEKFVSKIKVSHSDTNNNIVLIEWEGIEDNNLVYYVYRSTSPIIGKSSFSDSVVVDYIKATNNSKNYVILDRPIITSTYYYAVVSYINDLSFYNAKENVDTSSLSFNGITAKDTNESLSYNDTNDNNVLNNNLKYITNINNITNTVNVTNSYTLTNTVTFTNSVTVTNIVNITNNNISNGASAGRNNNNNSVNTQSEYSRYKSQYNRALAEFKLKNYSKAASILEPISRRNINKNLYYDINLLLGKCYKYMGRKKNALDVFNRIKSYNPKEVNFWINQVLSDL